MSRCETYNIAQVVKGPQLDTKEEEIEKSLSDDTKIVSIQDIIKDLRENIIFETGEIRSGLMFTKHFSQTNKASSNVFCLSPRIGPYRFVVFVLA